MQNLPEEYFVTDWKLTPLTGLWEMCCWPQAFCHTWDRSIKTFVICCWGDGRRRWQKTRSPSRRIWISSLCWQTQPRLVANCRLCILQNTAKSSNFNVYAMLRRCNASEAAKSKAQKIYDCNVFSCQGMDFKLQFETVSPLQGSLEEPENSQSLFC